VSLYVRFAIHGAFIPPHDDDRTKLMDSRSCQHASYDEGDLELEGTSILQKRKSLLDLCKMHDLEHASSCPSNMHLQTRFRSSPTSGSPRLPLSPISSVHNHMSTSLVLDSPPPLARVNTEGALDSHVASALRANTQMTLRDVELLEVLGQGGYATTYRARIVNGTQILPPSSSSSGIYFKGGCSGEGAGN
jgi:hypothetical protein